MPTGPSLTPRVTPSHGESEQAKARIGKMRIWQVGSRERRSMKRELTVLGQNQQEAVSCASLLKVLADETRLAVIEQLLTGPKHVAEINESLGVEPTLLSHHLRVLRDAQLVTSQRDGKHVVYSLAKAVQGERQGRAINLGCCLISFE